MRPTDLYNARVTTVFKVTLNGVARATILNLIKSQRVLARLAGIFPMNAVTRAASCVMLYCNNSLGFY